MYGVLHSAIAVKPVAVRDEHTRSHMTAEQGSSDGQCRLVTGTKQLCLDLIKLSARLSSADSAMWTFVASLKQTMIPRCTVLTERALKLSASGNLRTRVLA